METTRALLLACATLATACDDSSPVKEPRPGNGTVTLDSGSSTVDAGVVDADPAKDCFDDPTTHFEIINACTTATRIAKAPALGKLLPDGGLPPLN